MANFAVCASVIPEGVETTSGVSSCAYPLTTMFTSYLALVFVVSSLSRRTEEGQSSLVGSVENSTGNHMLYSGLPALYDLSSGSYQWASSHRLHLLPTCPLWMYPIHLVGIVTCFILYSSCRYEGTNSCAKAPVTCNLLFRLSVFKCQ